MDYFEPHKQIKTLVIENALQEKSWTYTYYISEICTSENSDDLHEKELNLAVLMISEMKFQLGIILNNYQGLDCIIHNKKL